MTGETAKTGRSDRTTATKCRVGACHAGDYRDLSFAWLQLRKLDARWLSRDLAHLVGLRVLRESWILLSHFPSLGGLV